MVMSCAALSLSHRKWSGNLHLDMNAAQGHVILSLSSILRITLFHSFLSFVRLYLSNMLTVEAIACRSSTLAALIARRAIPS